jgi:PAS domain S-box-containing protein
MSFLFGCLLAFAAGLPAVCLYLYSATRRKREAAAGESRALRVEELSFDAILTVDESGIICGANAAAERIFGYKVEAILRQPVSFLFPAASGGKSGALGVNALNAARRTPDGVGLELEGQRRDGTKAPLDVVLSEEWAMGRRVFRIVARDMTDRRRIEALSRDATMLGDIIDSAATPIVVLDADGCIARFNQAGERLTDLRYSDVRGRPYWEALVDQREWPEAKAALTRALAMRTIEKGHTTWLARDGSSRNLSVALSALPAGRSGVEGAVLVAVETEGRATQAEAQDLDAVERLAGGIAQHFNDLLTSINGYSDLLLHSMPEKDPLRRDVEEIRQAGERAASLTSQLLAFSHKQPMRSKVVDLNELINGMQEPLKMLVGDRVQVSTVLDLELGTLKADPSWLEQVILNVTVNARDAMPDGGRLAIETANVTLDETEARRVGRLTAGSYVTLAITDTGSGILEEHRSRVFEPFFTTKGPGKGLGLGLSTAYGVVRQWGGTIVAESVPGCGTTFRIYLPQVQENEQSAKNARGLFLVRGAGQ